MPSFVNVIAWILMEFNNQLYQMSARNSAFLKVATGTKEQLVPDCHFMIIHNPNISFLY
jgi:hypothetical protein